MTHTKSLFLTLMGAAALSQAAKVHYDLDLTWKRGAPNGVEREMIFVNDRFPGPPLILDEGDEVTVGCPALFSKRILREIDRRDQQFALQYICPFPRHWVGPPEIPLRLPHNTEPQQANQHPMGGRSIRTIAMGHQARWQIPIPLESHDLWYLLVPCPRQGQNNGWSLWWN